MTTTNYQDILNESWDNIQQVAVLPIGCWLLRCRNASMQPPKGEGKSPSALFVYEAVEPMEDVDQGALDELGKDYKYAENRIFKRFWVENGADKDAIRAHIEKHGISCEGMTIGESLKAVKGLDVVAYLTQRQFTSGGETKVENEPQNFVAAD